MANSCAREAEPNPTEAYTRRQLRMARTAWAHVSPGHGAFLTRILGGPKDMHEMSVAQSLIDIIHSEMDKNAVTTLQTVKVKAGRINAIVPEALQTAFWSLTQGTSLQGARLELETVPLELECGSCGTRFISSTEDTLLLHAECPDCGWEFGHRVITGRELYIEYIEAD